MVLALFHYLFGGCCRCGQHDDNDACHEINAESSRLIPDDLEATIYTNQAFIDQQKIQRRLDTIVRAKEGKMVNVNSRIPFNLHNQVIPSDNHYIISRSTSGSFDLYTHNYSAGDFERPVQHQHSYQHQYQYQCQLPDPSDSISKAYTHARSSVSHFYDDAPHTSWSRSGSRSCEREPARGPNPNPNPNPILNVRLVGFSDRRGRSGRCRFDTDVGSENAVMTLSMPATRPGDTAGSDTLSSQALSLAAKLKQQEFSALSMSWGD